MLNKLEKQREEKKMYSISAALYIRENGEFIICSQGDNYFLNNHKYGNINEISDDKLYELIIKQLIDSLNRDSILSVDQCGKDADKIYLWEKDDYKKDKCKSVKNILISITSLYPHKIVLVDEVCLGSHHWGGGKYVHLLPNDSSKETIISKLREIYDYKNGHLAGTSEEEQKKCRVITKR